MTEQHTGCSLPVLTFANNAQNCEHYAFGNQKTNTADSNPFRYCGEYYDNETGFIYLRNRYYDPSIGRFTTEDPVKDGDNWYAYCGNNPVNYIDPWGLWESLRKLVEQTTGSVSWIGNNNMAGILGEKNTATVKINEKTQKYNVINGKVYVNGNEVGYIENDRIIVDEQDFYQDFDIAGTISICAYWDSEENLYISNTNIRVDSFSGHAYIEFTDLNGNFEP